MGVFFCEMGRSTIFITIPKKNHTPFQCIPKSHFLITIAMKTWPNQHKRKTKGSQKNLKLKNSVLNETDYGDITSCNEITAWLQRNHRTLQSKKNYQRTVVSLKSTLQRNSITAFAK